MTRDPQGAGSSVDPVAADGFGLGADAYEQARPSYPSELVRELTAIAALGPGRSVLDLAAGTGKLTRLLEPSGARVVAVEPVAAMREKLAVACPDVEALEGTAEAIPLDDASVDLVTVGQAFHWFDAPAALAEIHRVLRPGGVVALVWNTRDRTVVWISAWDDLIRECTPSQPFDVHWRTDWLGVLRDAPGFGPPTAWSCDWVDEMDAERLVTRTASVSVVASLPVPEQLALFARVRDLTATHPDLADRARFGFPYIATLFWATAE